ncbi:hypothetical protein [Parabacteroides goldsteinii]|uniref:hypothetical protein n=1 Tax=Parabacteroides goldsteinii TaxID=328812 RepID=UPI001DF3B07A|nr:hypothetical protein [Parabacteroides goldsteinii]MBS6574807.1 hypothetical protein [Parabacteroides goldsteinii]
MFKREHIKEQMKSYKLKIENRVAMIYTNYYAHTIAIFVFCGVCALLCAGTYYNAFDYNLKYRIIEFRAISLTVYGVLIGVFVTFLISRSIQTRQERLLLLDKLRIKTIQLHKFRYIIKILTTEGFIPLEEISSFNRNHKNLRYSNYNTQVENIDIIANFTNDPNYKPIWLFYLQLKLFIDQPGLPDLSLYSSKSIYKTIPLEEIAIWQYTEAANCFFYYLQYEYRLVEKHIKWDLNKNSFEKIINACKEIDPIQYRDVEFNQEWLVKLGNHFLEEIIPSAYILQAEIESGIPPVIKYLRNLLILLCFFGITLPIISFLFGTFIILDIIATSMLISICIFIIFSISDLLEKEVSVAKKHLI